MARDKVIARIVQALLQNTGLPVELCDEIASYIDRSQLFELTVLSPQLHDLVTETLYRNVRIQLKSRDKLRQLLCFFRSVLTNQKLANSVRSLSLVGEPLSIWRSAMVSVQSSRNLEEFLLAGRYPRAAALNLSSWNSYEVDEYQAQLESWPLPRAIRTSVPGMELQCAIILLLRRLTKLQHLRMSSDIFRCKGFPEAFRSITDHGAFAELESVNLCMDLADVVAGRHKGMYAVNSWDEALTLPFYAPKVQSACILAALSRHSVINVTQPSVLRMLVLYHVFASDETKLEALLKALPCLEHFEYHARYENSWQHNCCKTLDAMEQSLGDGQILETHPISTALTKAASTLKTLVISEDYFGDNLEFEAFKPSICQPIFKPINVKLKQVKQLRVPFPALVGWFSTSMAQIAWETLLPSGLESLILTDEPLSHLHPQATHYGTHWTESTLKAMLMGLMDWLVTDSPQVVLGLRTKDYFRGLPKPPSLVKLEQYAVDLGIRFEVSSERVENRQETQEELESWRHYSQTHSREYPMNPALASSTVQRLSLTDYIVPDEEPARWSWTWTPRPRTPDSELDYDDDDEDVEYDEF